MYKVEILITTIHDHIVIKTFEADDLEQAEESAGNALAVLRRDGLLDDDENHWKFYPSHSIYDIAINFEEVKENETSNEGTANSEFDQDSET